MTDQAQRLEIATVRAEIGSNITYRFNNDAIDALLIPTDSGDIKNLKQVIAAIQQEGAEKISFATRIYPTTAAGIASTVNGEIFLVASSDADEIYEVWKNNAGVALDTGKRAISASAVIAATDAAQASADSAQSAADQANAKVAPFLSPSSSDPTARDGGAPLQPGDTYFNTVIEATKVYSNTGWVAANVTGTDLADAINTREPSIPAGSAGQYWTGDKTFKTLDKSAVGLSNVNNTTDANKPVSTAQQAALDEKQDESANLTAFSALSGIADRIAYFTAAGAMALSSLTAQARTFLAATTQAAQRTALGLGNAAVRDSRALPIEMLTPSTQEDGTAFGYNTTMSGTGNGNQANAYEFRVTSDSTLQKAGTAGMTGSKVNGLRVYHNFGGANTEGGRHAGYSILLQGFGGGGATSASNTDRNYVGHQGQVITDSGDGGTSAADTRGAYFGLSSAASVLGGQWVTNLTACEFNTTIAAGSGNRVYYHSGIQIASSIGERGYGIDAAISLSNLNGTWKNGLLAHGGNGVFPFAADSSFMKLTPASVTNMDWLFDARSVNFTGGILGTATVGLAETGLTLARASAQVVIGNSTQANTPVIKMRSSGSGSDYDVRMQCTGGSATAGAGALVFSADGLVTPLVRPSTDNAFALGANSFRWSVVYAGTGTINTSDAREKTEIRRLEDRELDAAKLLSKEIGAFQFLDSIKNKDEDARLHIGMTVQRAIEIMESCGLDPMNYAFICHDEWGAADEVVSEDAEGNRSVVQPAIKAGDRYGFRMDQLLAFIAAGFESRLIALESK